eukprot:XP_014064048.1 PREDICTED: plexin-A4-like [Salmo salar]
MNAPLGVSEMVQGIPLFSDSTDKMTSVIAYVYKNHSLAFVGTKSGRVKKLQMSTEPHKSHSRDCGLIAIHWGCSSVETLILE